MSDRIFLSGFVILFFLSALFVGLNQLSSTDAPRFALNGAAGSSLVATMLLILIARIWRPAGGVLPFDLHAVLSLEEPKLQYGAALLFGLCLIGLGGLGLSGYTGQPIEIIAGTLLSFVGVGVLIHKLLRGRARLTLSPNGIAHGRAAVITWDRIAGARLSALSWSSMIYIDVKEHADAKARKLRLNPMLLGAEPTSLFETIEARRAAYTF